MVKPTNITKVSEKMRFKVAVFKENVDQWFPIFFFAMPHLSVSKILIKSTCVTRNSYYSESEFLTNNNWRMIVELILRRTTHVEVNFSFKEARNARNSLSGTHSRIAPPPPENQIGSHVGNRM